MWNSMNSHKALWLGVLTAAAVFLWGISGAAIADCNGTDNPDLCKAYNQASQHKYHPSNHDDGAAEHARREDEKNFKEIDREFNQSDNSTDDNSKDTWRPHHDYSNRPTYSPPAPSPQQHAAQWRSSGINAYNNGDWSDAINDFNQALQYTPNDSNLEVWLQAAQRNQAQAQASADAAARQQQLEAIAAGISNAHQEAQTETENRAQSLQSLADDVAAAQAADARGDWQDAYSDWQSALWIDKNNAAILAAMKHDSNEMDQEFAAHRNAAAGQLRGGGAGTDLGQLRGTALADAGDPAPGAAGSSSRWVRGNSEALAQLRGIAVTSNTAANAGNPEAAKSGSGLGFDTAGITGSGAYAYRVTTTAFQSVPAATRSLPQFQGMIKQVAEFNGERAHVRKQEIQVEKQLTQNPSPKKKGDLQVALVNLRQKESNIFNQEATVIVKAQQNLHFNVNVSKVIAAISVKPASIEKHVSQHSQTVAKAEPK